jgi:WD40 repeat protein
MKENMFLLLAIIFYTMHVLCMGPIEMSGKVSSLKQLNLEKVSALIHSKQFTKKDVLAKLPRDLQDALCKQLKKPIILLKGLAALSADHEHCIQVDNKENIVIINKKNNYKNIYEKDVVATSFSPDASIFALTSRSKTTIRKTADFTCLHTIPFRTPVKFLANCSIIIQDSIAILKADAYIEPPRTIISLLGTKKIEYFPQYKKYALTRHHPGNDIYELYVRDESDELGSLKKITNIDAYIPVLAAHPKLPLVAVVVYKNHFAIYDISKIEEKDRDHQGNIVPACSMLHPKTEINEISFSPTVHCVTASPDNFCIWNITNEHLLHIVPLSQSLPITLLSWSTKNDSIIAKNAEGTVFKVNPQYILDDSADKKDHIAENSESQY